jgi:hypothetical protein
VEEEEEDQQCVVSKKRIYQQKYVLSAIDRLHGERSGNGVGMRLLRVARAAIANEKEEKVNPHQIH